MGKKIGWKNGKSDTLLLTIQAVSNCNKIFHHIWRSSYLMTCNLKNSGKSYYANRLMINSHNVPAFNYEPELKLCYNKCQLIIKVLSYFQQQKSFHNNQNLSFNPFLHAAIPGRYNYTRLEPQSSFCMVLVKCTQQEWELERAMHLQYMLVSGPINCSKIENFQIQKSSESCNSWGQKLSKCSTYPISQGGPKYL